MGHTNDHYRKDSFPEITLQEADASYESMLLDNPVLRQLERTRLDTCSELDLVSKMIYLQELKRIASTCFEKHRDDKQVMLNQMCPGLKTNADVMSVNSGLLQDLEAQLVKIEKNLERVKSAYHKRRS